MRVLFFTMLLLFISKESLTKKVETFVDDGRNIKEVRLIVEDISNQCFSKDDVVSEVKYLLYQSNIKLDPNSDYFIYVNVNINKVKNRDICYGSIHVSLNSYVWHRTFDISKRVVHFAENTTLIKSSPFNDYIRNALNNITKEIIIWILENWFYTEPALKIFW